MNRISNGLRFQIFALALGGISIFIFVALISPYTQTRARLKLLQPQIRMAVAAERFLRYSALEIKDVIDYGLIEDGEDRNEELQKNTQEIARSRLEATKDLSDLRSATETALKTGKTIQLQNNLLVIGRLELNYTNLALIEQRLYEMAANSVSKEQLATLVHTEFIPSATAFSALSNQVVQDQVTDMQSGVSRLSGNLDGIVLYSGNELRARAEVMNGNALKEVQAGLYARQFTKALHNFSEFLLTGNQANVSKIRGVMVQGRWLPKAELQRMLEALPVAYSAEKKFLASIAQSRPDALDKYLYENDPFHKLTNEVMLDLVITKGIGALKQVYSRLEDVDRASIALEEATVDDLGFQLLDLNRDSDAIQLFLSNVQRHPASARVYDSLAQAYVKSGNRTQAVKYFTEALRIDASFEHAREALNQLGSHDEEK